MWRLERERVVSWARHGSSNYSMYSNEINCCIVIGGAVIPSQGSTDFLDQEKEALVAFGATRAPL